MIELSQPLPECGGCGRPVRRATWERRGGRCTGCAAWTDLAATIGPDQALEEAERLAEWNATAGRIRRAEIAAAVERRRARRLRQRRA